MNEQKKTENIFDEEAAELLLEEFEEFGSDAPITDEEQSRILSSVMRKAGFDMNETMTTKKTGKHGKRFITLMAAAALLGTGALGAGAYGIYVNHRQSVDSYLGEGAADTLEQQGLLDGSETAVSEHYKITQETVLSTGNITSIIVTVEGIDEEGRAALDSGYKYLFADTEDVQKASEKRLLEYCSNNWQQQGEGCVVCMFNFEYRTPDSPVTAEVGLYLCDSDEPGKPYFVGDLTDGEYLGKADFTTVPNVEGVTLTGETNGKTISLYDFALTSNEYIPIDNTNDSSEWYIEIENSDGSSDRLTIDDISSLGHAGHEEVTELTDPKTQTNTRAVFSRLINAEEVTAVTIDGERYVR